MLRPDAPMNGFRDKSEVIKVLQRAGLTKLSRRLAGALSGFPAPLAENPTIHCDAVEDGPWFILPGATAPYLPVPRAPLWPHFVRSFGEHR
jgi:hypothetical protein